MNLEQTAIDTLRRFEPFEGYHLAFSGGKDSIVCLKLCELAGVKFRAVYSITTVDFPHILPFIRKNYPQAEFDRPSMSMYDLIVKMGILPTRLSRFCCEVLKEYSGKGKLVITGIRSEESNARKKRRLLQIDSRKNMNGKAYLNIIIEWKESDVWNLITKYKLPVPEYYTDCKSARGGCVGCPMRSKNQKKELDNMPRFKYAYLKAITKAMKNGKFSTFESPEDVFQWWISDESIKNYKEKKKQLTINY
jgi:phosphoadenosine phosphosulfate reductase